MHCPCTEPPPGLESMLSSEMATVATHQSLALHAAHTVQEAIAPGFTTLKVKWTEAHSPIAALPGVRGRTFCVCSQVPWLQTVQRSHPIFSLAELPPVC